MPVPSDPTAARPRLTRERVLECALGVADDGGIASLTIRSLAAELGVKPMSVYHHVENKEAILDGIVDLVFAEMERVPRDADGAWRDQIVQRAHATQHGLRRHPWAIGLLESRSTPGPATLRHQEETARILRVAGFSVEMTAHASALLDSFVCGFAVQEAARPFGKTSMRPNGGRDSAPLDPETYPHLAEMAEKHMLRPGYDFGEEFQLGLDLILDALDPSAHAGHLAPS